MGKAERLPEKTDILSRFFEATSDEFHRRGVATSLAHEAADIASGKHRKRYNDTLAKFHEQKAHLRSQHAPSKSTPRSHPTSPVISQQSMVLSANAATSRASRTVLPGHAPWTSSARSKSTLSSALHAAIARFTVPPAQRISTRPTVRSFFPSKAPTNNDQPCRTQPHSRARSIIERKASPSSNTFRSQRRHHGR